MVAPVKEKPAQRFKVDHTEASARRLASVAPCLGERRLASVGARHPCTRAHAHTHVRTHCTHTHTHATYTRTHARTRAYARTAKGSDCGHGMDGIGRRRAPEKTSGISHVRLNVLQREHVRVATARCEGWS